MLRPDTEDFPFQRTDAGIWYLVITHEEKEIKLKAFSSKNAHLLRRHIKALTKKKIEYRVLGSWHGQWRTDLFVIDSEILERI